MSGICGYINLDKKPIKDPGVIKDMSSAIAHRGGAGENFFIKDNVALGRRVAFDKDRGMTLVCDGEAYNFRGPKEAFLEWGRRAFEKINGSFSLAAWDEKEKKLILARDRLGIKPLYYATFGDTFLFASEIKSILKHPLVRREIDVKGMLKYFAHDYIPNPYTIFKGISKLEPGFYAVLSGRRLEKKQYWNIKFDETRREKNPEEYGFRFRELLKESVKKRLAGEAPVGVFLSGGLDSSCIVAMMAELAPEKPIKTFSIGFKERHFDESGDARIVAQYFKTDHREQIIDAKKMLDVLPDILSLLDEPFADYSIIPTYCAAEFAKKYVPIVMGGDGGDEFFGGYQSYTAHKISRILKNVPFSTNLLRAASKAAGGKSSYMSTGFKLRRYIRGLAYPEDVRHQVWIGSFPPNEQEKLLSKDFRRFLKSELVYDESYRYIEDVKNLNYLNRINYLYAKTYLADDGLPKVDRASAAAGLGVRAPFLDRDFIEFATSVPVGLKLKGFTNKYIIKRAMSGRLPERILHKPKHGFAAPVGEWFKKELKGPLLDIFERGKIEREGIFNFDHVDHIIKSHLSGKVDYARELWSLFVFQMWRDRWL